jgi:cell wall-associated NlpC family hydrolase
VEARPGDLVFFGKGKNVQHVGIVASRSAKSLFMIHSSSGRGVLKEDAMASEYWKKRVLYAVDLSSL